VSKFGDEESEKLEEHGIVCRVEISKRWQAFDGRDE